MGDKNKEESQDEINNSRYQSLERVGSRWFWFKRSWLTQEKINIATLMLSVFALLVAIFLYLSTQEQVRISRDTFNRQQIKDSSDESQQRIRDSINRKYFETSLMLTKRNTDSTIAFSKNIALQQERFSKLNSRAYICFADTFSFVIPPVGKEIKVRMQYTNVGNTPAYNVRAFLFGIIDYQQDYQRMFDMKYRADFEESFKIFPVGTMLGRQQSSKTFWGGNPWIFAHDDSINVFKNGKVFIMIFALRYNDKFGEEHTSTCFGMGSQDGRCTVIDSKEENKDEKTKTNLTAKTRTRKAR